MTSLKGSLYFTCQIEKTLVKFLHLIFAQVKPKYVLTVRLKLYFKKNKSK